MEKDIAFRREQFTFYRSFYNSVKTLSKKRQLEMLMAIVQYGLDCTEPPVSFTAQQSALFELIRPVLDTARRKAKNASIGGKKTRRTNDFSVSKNKKETENELELEIEIESESKGFDAFWARYPLALGRAEAEAAWKRATENTEDRIILQGLERWCRSKAWERESGRFIPKPVKFLDEGWFLQEPKEIPMGASGQLGKAEMEALKRMMED